MEIQSEPHVWNMFLRREARELWCGVPADAALPRFLFSGEWDFGGHHRDPERLQGFKTGVADQSVRMNGFYLFQRVMAAG